MQIQGESTNADVKLEQIDDYTREQIQEMVDHEAFQNPVAIMPDTHAGAGAVIGFTMPVGDRLVPNTIGVDIGCGMYAVNLGSDGLPDEDGHETDGKIRSRIPVGSNVHDDQNPDLLSHAFYQANTTLEGFIEKNDVANGPLEILYSNGGYDRDFFDLLCEEVGMDKDRAVNSLGTLGGGNHFIELGVSQNTGDLWCTIHSGSRQLGLKVAQYWQEVATENHERLDFSEIPDSDIDYLKADGSIRHEKVREDHEGEEIGAVFDRLNSYRPADRNEDLDYLEGVEAERYVVDMIFAQAYASVSRKLMAAEVAEALGGRTFYDKIESVHNYIDFEDYTIRKGATGAKHGERAVVPFNPRDGTLIIEGKGNAAWNFSAPHGAGRTMSRREAKRQFTQEDADEAMEGITASRTPIDEIAGAYKDAALIESAIEPTASIVDRIEPVLNVKA